jgi:hypothetical protein
LELTTGTDVQLLGLAALDKSQEVESIRVNNRLLNKLEGVTLLFFFIFKNAIFRWNMYRDVFGSNDALRRRIVENLVLYRRRYGLK